jgi:hypothetical protein
VLKETYFHVQIVSYLNMCSLFFILYYRAMLFERVTSHYYHINIYEHITYTTVNIRIGMSDPSVA